MRPTVPLSILLSACAAPSRYAAGRLAAASLPRALEQLAGVWNGRLYRGDADVGTPFSLLQGGTADSPVVGQFALSTAPGRPAPVQLLEASAATYVALVGPYADPVTDAQVVTVIETRKVGDRLHGTYRTQPLSGGRATGGRVVAARSRLAAA
ncbi:MAG: hypothetical protein ACJ79S_20130 [Gemmatimonadaceae bacterium]